MLAGGLSTDGRSWAACTKGFFLPARVLSRIVRARYLDGRRTAHAVGLLGDLSLRAREAPVGEGLAKPCSVVVRQQSL